MSVLREDLNHPFVSGNKWWKLRDNLLDAKKSGKPVLTFGGAFSNHLYATAAACAEAGISCAAVVRGEEGPDESPTLRFAKSLGMNLIFVSRQLYQQKYSHRFFEALGIDVEKFFLIPEGGTNLNAILACADWGQKIKNNYSNNFDAVLMPIGTGGTAAGIIAGLDGSLLVNGFSVLKDGGFLKHGVNALIADYYQSKSLPEKPLSNRWILHTDFHFGGYGKRNPEVISFIKEVNSFLPLDAVYTAKMLLGIISLTRLGYYQRGTRLLALHTGGLQGNAGFSI